MTGLGIDLGSRQAKLAALDKGEVLWLRDFETIPFYRQYGKVRDGRLYLDFAALGLLSAEELARTPLVVTGYGRNTLDLVGARVVPEIQAHLAGARWQTGLATFTLLDLGGQDSKVARLENGRLLDFVMNDKCAASSGRYLENMATVLGIDLEELSRHHRNPVPLDATCGIFGESELIGKIIEGHPLEELCAGVNGTLIQRVMPMLRRFPADVLVVTGGVARNGAFIELLKKNTGAKVLVPSQPQHNGAIGCALLAAEPPKS
jgi:(R)-2-hydroxyacyl-CoA dehydratese activating ATPase